MSIASNELQNSLDVEFRQVLYVIKPFIKNINNHHHLEQYRVWLERLNDSSSAEKYERNKYLIELANQIHDDDLKPPFIFQPPRGPLPKLKYYQKEVVEDTEQWPYTSRRASVIDSKVSLRRHLRSKDVSPQKRKSPKRKLVPRPFEKLGKTDCLRSETSSWYDLTEIVTSFNLGCGDIDDDDGKKKKYEEENQNQFKKTDASSFDLKSFLSSSLDELNNDRAPTQQDVDALKMRMQDLLEVKNALKDTHCLTENRKKTIGNLQNKLAGLEKENTELRTSLEDQKNKNFELEKLKINEINEFKDKFSKLRQKEIEILKKHYKDEIEGIESKNCSKISIVQSEIQQKIESVKKEYEDKIKKISESSLETLKEKDEKIFRLQAELKVKETQPPDQNNEQIIALKKCISKLDKVLHKNEKDYVKKIEKLKQELEVKEMTTQVQLQTQKADLLVRNSATRQEELKNALNILESKYKKMMETLQIHALSAKKYDEKLIEDLRTLLDKHNIIY